MKALIFLLVVAIAVVVAIYAVKGITYLINRYRETQGEWEVEQAINDGVAIIYLKSPKPGADYGVVGSVSLKEADCDERIRVLRREAQFKADALNERL